MPASVFDVKLVTEDGTYTDVPTPRGDCYKQFWTNNTVSDPPQGLDSCSGMRIEYPTLQTTLYPRFEDTKQSTLADGSKLLQVAIDMTFYEWSEFCTRGIQHKSIDTPISILTKTSKGHQIISSKGHVHIDVLWVGPMSMWENVPSDTTMKFEAEDHPLHGKTLKLKTNKQHMAVEDNDQRPLRKLMFLTASPFDKDNPSKQCHIEYYIRQTEGSEDDLTEDPKEADWVVVSEPEDT